MRTRRKSLAALVVAVLTAALLTAGGVTLPATATVLPATTGSLATPSRDKPTIVLVHGAFADSSGWSVVAAGLQAQGYPVLAFANPLRGVQYDSAYLRSVLDTIPGPIVLVGHSYGGAVITNASTGDPDIRSLVYLAAYALDEGETVQQANALGGGQTDLGDHLVIRPFPGAAPGDADATIDPAYFRELFAQDLPRAVSATMAATQRPAALAAFGTPSGVPGWKSIPTWYMVAKQDRTIPPVAERAMAARAGSTTVEVNSSHVPMLSQPLAVLALITRASR
jgi:pimeloyl-ACP methyl ester carboxylesterase